MSASVHFRAMRLTITLGDGAPRSFVAKLRFGYRDEDDVWLSGLETSAQHYGPPFELPHHLWVDSIAGDEALMQSLGDQARDERAARGGR